MSTPDGNGSRSNWGIWMLAGGYLLIALALGLGSSGAGAEFAGKPICDGTPMSPGDTCREFRRSRSDLDIDDYSYEQVLAGAQIDAKTGPWQKAMWLGFAGTILVFVGAGRHLALRRQRGRRRATRATLMVTTLPLLGAAALLWPLEMRYAPEYRSSLSSSDLWPFDPQLPGAPSLMIVLVLVGTAITVGVVLARLREHAVFAMGGWGARWLFSRLDGVLKAEIGYAGGGTQPFLVEGLATGKTRHARVVRLSFDPGRIPYEALLKVFWEHNEPGRTSTANQYRSAIFATRDDQLAAARASRDAFAPVAAAAGRARITSGTEIRTLDQFWHARANVDRHHRQNPDSDGVITPNGLTYPDEGRAGSRRTQQTGSA